MSYPARCVFALGFLLAFSGSAWAADSAVQRLATGELPAHPRLLVSRSGVERLKSRVAELDWAQRWWRRFLAGVDSRLKRPVELPPRGGNWYHWYVCPEDGSALRRGRSIGKWRWEHRCELCNKVWTGGRPDEPSRDYDGCAIQSVHFDYAYQVRNCGLAWQVTGERRYFERARRILLDYAAKYLSYPLHRIHGGPGIGGGRVASQTLTEACWLIPIAQGADLIWPSLDEGERRRIASKLLLPAARDVILPHRLGVHNIQCWKNSAVGLVGLLLADETLIREAMDDPECGYRTQMREGVSAAGSWYEGSWGYHFYTLQGTWPLVEAARNCGIDLYCPDLRAMFDIPIKLMSPTGVLPAFNDSHTVSVRRQAALYELAYARFGNARYLAVLGGDRVTGEAGRVSRGDMAVLYGVESLPGRSQKPQKHVSANYPAAGFAILAKGQGDRATWLCLDYGPHGGGHGHPDKLSFVLFACGVELSLDPGTARYGTPIQRSWYRTTIAHNTVTVAERSQRPATGECLAFGSVGPVDFLIADAGEAIASGTFRRAVALVDQHTVVFTDRVRLKAAATIDVAYHQRGRWVGLPAGGKWPVPDKAGYKHLRDAAVRTGDQPLRLSIAHEAAPKAAILVAGGCADQIITAIGIGARPGEKVPALIMRRSGREATFVWAVSIDGRLQRLQFNRDGADHVIVRLGYSDGQVTQLGWNLSRKSAGLRMD